MTVVTLTYSNSFLFSLSFSYEILQALVTDVDPAPKVKSAMNAIMEAKRMKDATIHKAEAIKISIVKAAEGVNFICYYFVIILSLRKFSSFHSSQQIPLFLFPFSSSHPFLSAEAESKALAGAGMARQRLAIVDGLRDSVVHFADEIEGATAKDVMDMVLVTQYFDTLKELGNNPHVATVFVPHDQGGLRKEMLEAGAGGQFLK